MIAKITESNAYGWLVGVVIGLAGFIFVGQNKRIDKGENKTAKNTGGIAKNTGDIKEVQHNIRDMKISLDTISRNGQKIEEGNNLIWNTIIKRFDDLEAKIDNKK